MRDGGDDIALYSGTALDEVAAVAVAFPVVLSLLLGDRMVPPLRAAEEWLQRHTSSITAIVIGLIGAFLTAAYMTRCVYLTFFGEYRGTHHPHESERSITIS